MEKLQKSEEDKVNTMNNFNHAAKEAKNMKDEV